MSFVTAGLSQHSVRWPLGFDARHVHRHTNTRRRIRLSARSTKKKFSASLPGAHWFLAFSPTAPAFCPLQPTTSHFPCGQAKQSRVRSIAVGASPCPRHEPHQPDGIHVYHYHTASQYKNQEVSQSFFGQLKSPSDRSLGASPSTTPTVCITPQLTIPLLDPSDISKSRHRLPTFAIYCIGSLHTDVPYPPAAHSTSKRASGRK